MGERGDFEAAAEAGVIAREQVDPLLAFLAARRAPAAPTVSGEEDLRFIRNFHDVFLAIGIVLFAIGLAIAAAVTGSGANGGQGKLIATGGLLAGAAVLQWVLGEIFARRRRLFLPAIAIVCAFTGFAVAAALTLYGGIVVGRDINLDFEQGMPPAFRNGVLLAASMLVIAPALFYARFRLPFSIGMTGGGAAALAIVCGLLFAFEPTMRAMPSLLLGLGAVLFLAGIAFDARDPARATRLSDNGFWLHFAAAPLLLNGAFGLVGQAFAHGDAARVSALSPSSGLIMASSDGGATAQALATLAVVALLGFVSLLINRRALIVSALLTTGVAIGVLMNKVGLGAGALAASTLIVLGAFVLILGAGWHAVRRGLVGWIKPAGLWARIVPLEAGP